MITHALNCDPTQDPQTKISIDSQDSSEKIRLLESLDPIKLIVPLEEVWWYSVIYGAITAVGIYWALLMFMMLTFIVW